MDHRTGNQKGRISNILTLQSNIALRLIGSFDMMQSVGMASDVGGISTSSSEDSDMAQYSRRRRNKESEKKALQSVGFGMFDQCLTGRGFPDSDNAFTEIVKMTKDILLPVLCQPDNDVHYHQTQEETATMEEENVEIGEDEILRHDYFLERV
mmetsp:Transcript_18691/g.35525  ORF Transcript_18691/g.35525 Transcript_18691/m.35525 type:complete len:153 (+) Transcript_18691:49-507(+)|eukprot:scaffold11639_cov172-Amphora_coffeaeformis.AAC.24